ncbi:GntR family transcriptional regulator [Brachybacterium vulturis]|uniref:GntR family transcriptional regulator n=1 Tax=Brachybacterium vulturis TaxID=2017484 RepID=UPI003735FE95
MSPVSCSDGGESMTQWSTDPRTVNEVAFDRLRDLILNGQLAMGERLDERSLAERIAVSRTPLRDAIGRLANLGVIEQRTYRGSFLRVFTRTQVAELYELRKLLEGLATRKATAQISVERLDELGKIVDRGTRAFNAKDTEMFEAADREFHALIAEESGNGLLVEHLKNLELRIQLVRHLVNLEHDVAALTVDDRQRVLDAMREGDADGAELAMIDHIGVVEAEALRRLPVSA